MSTEPLIWTTKGNIPIASLEYRYGWDNQPDYIKFTEQYLLDGEVVKESSHAYSKVGTKASALAASF